MGYFILVDCNNFFVSCERVFNPKLEKKPVIVLSNNDGCVVARSQEVKQIGIGMCDPYFKIKDLCERHKVFVYSSNYQLYGDFSARVMDILKGMAPEIQVYSIDEAFLYYETGSEEEIFARAIEIRKMIKKWIGIPTSLGIAPTKTLAKVAGSLAKKDLLQGVFSLSSKVSQEKILHDFPIGEVWGVGRKSQVKLQSLGVYTAKLCREMDPIFIRKQLGVGGERILWELRGISCLALEEVESSKSITCSRSFGSYVTELTDLSEALATYVSKAAHKLREQGLCTKTLCVYVEEMFDKEMGRRQSVSEISSLPFPTNDTPEIIHAAKACLKKMFRPNVQYKKCGVVFLDLVPESSVGAELFWKGLDPKRRKLAKLIDELNSSKRKDAIFYGATGINPHWKMRSEKRSPRFTTSWDEIAVVKA